MTHAERRRLWRYGLMGFVIVLGGLAVLAVVYILVEGTSSRNAERLLVSLLSVGLASVMSLGALFALSRGRGRIPAVLALLGVPLMAGLQIALICDYWSWPEAEPPQVFCLALTVGVIGCVVIALLGLARLPGLWRWGRLAAQTCVVLLAVLLGMMSMERYLHLLPNERIWLDRGTILLCIVTACALLCVPILHWLNTLRERAAVTTRLVLSLTCPRCGLTQELPAGGAECGRCKLRLRIEIEEEQCPKCGYLLYKLTSTNCPECGTPIPAYQRPEASAAAEAALPAVPSSLP
jgi:hypothetical protein